MTHDYSKDLDALYKTKLELNKDIIRCMKYSIIEYMILLMTIVNTCQMTYNRNIFGILVCSTILILNIYVVIGCISTIKSANDAITLINNRIHLSKNLNKLYKTN